MNQSQLRNLLTIAVLLDGTIISIKLVGLYLWDMTIKILTVPFQLSTLLMVVITAAMIPVMVYVSRKGGQMTDMDKTPNVNTRSQPSSPNSSSVNPMNPPQTLVPLHHAGFTPAILDESKVEVQATSLDTKNAERKPIEVKTPQEILSPLTPYLEKKRLVAMDYLKSQPNHEASQVELCKYLGSCSSDVIKIMKKSVEEGMVGAYAGPAPKGGGRRKKYYRLIEKS